MVAGALNHDGAALLAVLAIGCVWLAATAAEQLPIPPLVTIAAEAALVGAVSGLAVGHTFQVLTVLAFPPFTAALRRGPRGALVSFFTELVTFVFVAVAAYGGFSEVAGTSALTWFILSLGLGPDRQLHPRRGDGDPDPLDSYRSAQALIRELIGLSGSLNAGLEPVTLAAGIAGAVQDELPVRALVVHVPRGDLLTPIINDHGGAASELEASEDLAARAWRHGEILVDRHAFALPLASEAGTVAVVSGFLSPGLDPVALGLRQTLADLSARLEPATVHLDTALLFAAFRDAATAEERRRLAREMHDGVAQEMASLGYLVDDILAEATSPEQALQLQVLRERLSSVVGEVRRSVRTLRTRSARTRRLGTAVGALARHLSAGSGMPIQVTLDESNQRLRPEVEASCCASRRRR